MNNMILSSKQIKFLKDNRIVILTTVDKSGKPRSILVELNKADSDEILITDNQMRTTCKNLSTNKKIALLAFKSDYSYGLKIFGLASYQIKGANFDFIKKLPENRNYRPKGVVAIKIKNIEEFS